MSGSWRYQPLTPQGWEQEAHWSQDPQTPSGPWLSSKCLKGVSRQHLE